MCNPHYQKWYRRMHPRIPGAHRARTRKYILRQYGLTQEDYDRLLRSQGGRCAICKVDSPGTNGHPNYSWCIDHEHETGKVRGLLCRACNVAIGLLRDDPAIVRAAARYIQRYRSAAQPRG